MKTKNLITGAIAVAAVAGVAAYFFFRKNDGKAKLDGYIDDLSDSAHEANHKFGRFMKRADRKGQRIMDEAMS